MRKTRRLNGVIETPLKPLGFLDFEDKLIHVSDFWRKFAQVLRQMGYCPCRVVSEVEEVSAPRAVLVVHWNLRKNLPVYNVCFLLYSAAELRKDLQYKPGDSKVSSPEVIMPDPQDLTVRKLLSHQDGIVRSKAEEIYQLLKLIQKYEEKQQNIVSPLCPESKLRPLT